MNTIVMRILSVLIGYAFGSIQSAYLLGKTRGIDIRDYGSGNAGTTNTIRVLGTKAGILVFFMDAFKCVFAVMAAWYLFGRSNPEMAYLFKSYAFAGCVLGHDYPFYMGFRGGKGVACMAGFICAYHWALFPTALIFFFVPYLLTHYVSLGSLCVYSGSFIMMIILGQMGVFGAPQPVLNEIYIISFPARRARPTCSRRNNTFRPPCPFEAQGSGSRITERRKALWQKSESSARAAGARP